MRTPCTRIVSGVLARTHDAPASVLFQTPVSGRYASYPYEGVAVFLGVRWSDKPTLVPDDKPKNVIVVKKYKPPPPKIQRKQIVQKKLTRKVPLPDPTPDEPEPIREPEPEIEPEPLPPDVPVILGVPDAPPPTGPLIAGSGGVTMPELIAETEEKVHVPNIVTAVLASFRGYDTFGETTVIFTAGVGVMLLLSARRRREETEAEAA